MTTIAKRAAVQLKLDGPAKVDLSDWNFENVLSENFEEMLLPLVVKLTTETLQIMFDVADNSVAHLWTDIGLEDPPGTIRVFVPLGKDEIWDDDLQLTVSLRDLIEGAVETYQTSDGRVHLNPSDRPKLEAWRDELRSLAEMIDEALTNGR